MITEEGEDLGIYTETLARLYWRQGFLGKALTIYQHLADLHPHQTTLQTHIRELQEQIRHNAQPLPTVTSARDSAVPSPRKPAPAALSEPSPSQTTHRVLRQLETWLRHLQQRTEQL